MKILEITLIDREGYAPSKCARIKFDFDTYSVLDNKSKIDLMDKVVGALEKEIEKMESNNSFINVDFKIQQPEIIDHDKP